MADAAQMQQALLNLMLNAEQAIRQIRENGHIWIRTRQLSAERVALEVADDGPGVAPEVVLRIFDPFFTTKPAGMGTGLGLSILYGIVQQHGGEVSVGDPAGRRSRIHDGTAEFNAWGNRGEAIRDRRAGRAKAGRAWPRRGRRGFWWWKTSRRCCN